MLQIRTSDGLGVAVAKVCLNCWRKFKK